MKIKTEDNTVLLFSQRKITPLHVMFQKGYRSDWGSRRAWKLGSQFVRPYYYKHSHILQHLYGVECCYADNIYFS